MDDISKLRNIGITAHIDAGKTTTTERVLFYSGTIHKSGDVDSGTTTTDFDQEEQQRGITIYSAAVTLKWKDHWLNLIDTPGHVDFTAEVERSLRVLDGAVVVFDAKEGVEAQSETVWRQADRYRVPRLCFINKMDKIGADFENAVRTIRERLHGNPIPIQLPLGRESEYRGFIDLLEMNMVTYAASGQDTKPVIGDIPADLHEAAAAARHVLDEKVAELDEELMGHYLEHESLTADQLRQGLRKGTLALACQPVLCGTALKYMGIQRMLDAVCDFLPSPLEVPPVRAHDPKDPEKIVERACDANGPLAALVFKIVADTHGDLFFIRVYSGTLKAGSRVTNVARGVKENLPKLFRIFAKRREQVPAARAGDIVAAVGLKSVVTGDTLGDAHKPVILETIDFPETVISMAIEPESSRDKDKLASALDMLARSDPTFQYRLNEETGQTLISGMGELHLEVMCHRLQRDFNVGVRIGKPRVAYREAITRAVELEERFVRETATGRNQFAVVRLRVEPFEPAPGEPVFRFRNATPEDTLPKEYVAAVQTGARSAAQSGPLGSYPLINTQVTLLGGETHPTDSSELAFETAGARAVSLALEQAGPVLLEPIMKVEIVTPEEYYGPINSDLNARRATITHTELRGSNQIIHCEAPLAAMFGYATGVRSVSQGRASYSMEPARYEKMPPSLAEKILGTY